MEEKKKVIVIGSGLSTGDAYAKMFAESENFKVIDFTSQEIRWHLGYDYSVAPIFGIDRPKLNDKNLGDGFYPHMVSDSFEKFADDIGKRYWYDQMSKIKPDVPKLTHWNDPIEPMVLGNKINKGDLENLVYNVLSKPYVSEIDQIMIQNFNENSEKFYSDFEVKTLVESGDYKKRGSNYTKPKNRKKKK